jgi:7-cyano-7-deazaguanine synthase
VEHVFAKRQCDIKGIPREVIHVAWSKPDRKVPTGREVADIRANASPAFLPGRNLVFLALGSAHAAGLGADEVWIGINSIDFSGYPDCTPEFFEAYASVHRIAVGNHLVRAPLLKMTKPEIARRAKELGIASGDTWSCYRPQLSSGAIRPCGECDACKLHAYAWQGIRCLAEVVSTKSDAVPLRFPKGRHKFVYYIIGSVGAGKSTANSNFRNIITYDEWIDAAFRKWLFPRAL